MTGEGLEAAVPAPNADSVELCLFEADGSETRLALVKGDDGVHRGSFSHARAGQMYGLRASGPWAPHAGLWHDPSLLLVDPFARAIAGRFVDHPSVHHDGPRRDTAAFVPRSVVVESPPPPRTGPSIPWSETVIYETHVRGLTMRHPDVDPLLRGTYLGVSSPPMVAHFRRLGVTTVELMPVAHHVSEPALQARGMSNYWGYSTLAWWAPHAGYATADDGRQGAEFAEMVDQLHAAGLEVIVDVVFNHTVEGGLLGPILSMKGLDNPGWYRLDSSGGYVDWTGTGNTIDTANPAVREAIVGALRWWAEGLGVDGFRFDLGVTLGRGEEQFDPEQLAWLTTDPVISTRKLITEPWDLGPDGYRLGGFGGEWREWNARFRDDVRDFWRGRSGAETMSVRLSGSPDVFADRSPESSLNLITAHDGFTLADLVSYDLKHNEANGENNHDGHNDNRSWNSGVEGPTDDAGILEIRRRRSSALLATLLSAAGVPMLLGGDELGRSQGGNNNAYPLDEPNWYDWSQTPYIELIARAVAVRRSHPMFAGGAFKASVTYHGGPATIELSQDDDRLAGAANPTTEPRRLPLPAGNWTLELDSSDTTATGSFEGDVIVPAWSLLLFRPTRSRAQPMM